MKRLNIGLLSLCAWFLPTSVHTIKQKIGNPTPPIHVQLSPIDALDEAIHTRAITLENTFKILKQIPHDEVCVFINENQLDTADFLAFKLSFILNHIKKIRPDLLQNPELINEMFFIPFCESLKEYPGLLLKIALHFLFGDIDQKDPLHNQVSLTLKKEFAKTIRAYSVEEAITFFDCYSKGIDYYGHDVVDTSYEKSYAVDGYFIAGRNNQEFIVNELRALGYLDSLYKFEKEYLYPVQILREINAKEAAGLIQKYINNKTPTKVISPTRKRLLPEMTGNNFSGGKVAKRLKF